MKFLREPKCAVNRRRLNQDDALLVSK